jgi:hypothetical protein
MNYAHIQRIWIIKHFYDDSNLVSPKMCEKLKLKQRKTKTEKRLDQKDLT